MSISLQEAKHEAGRLTSRLKALGVDIKHTQSLEGIAAVHNFSDWNRFQSSLNSIPVSRVFDSTTDRSRRGPNRVLVLRPGEGKTSIMALIFANAVREQAGIPLWIDCCGEESLSIFSTHTRDHTELVSVSFDSEGQILEMPSVSADCRGIFVRLRNPEVNSLTANGMAVRTKAFVNLLAYIKKSWPRGIVDRINWVLIDEFARLDERYPRLFDGAIHEFAGKHSTVVIGTQNIETGVAANSALKFRFISSTETAKFVTVLNSGAIATRDLVIGDANVGLEPTFSSSSTFVEDLTKLTLVKLHKVSVDYDFSVIDRIYDVNSAISIGLCNSPYGL